MKENSDAEGVGKIKAPSEDVQRILMRVMQKHLDIISMHKIGQATGLKHKVSRFATGGFPLTEGTEWVLLKMAVQEEIRLMESLVKDWKEIKSRI